MCGGRMQGRAGGRPWVAPQVLNLKMQGESGRREAVHGDTLACCVDLEPASEVLGLGHATLSRSSYGVCMPY
eukprot:scaffold92294_cov15-Tisochrysis_lutea.AAC.1